MLENHHGVIIRNQDAMRLATDLVPNYQQRRVGVTEMRRVSAEILVCGMYELLCSEILLSCESLNIRDIERKISLEMVTNIPWNSFVNFGLTKNFKLYEVVEYLDRQLESRSLVKYFNTIALHKFLVSAICRLSCSQIMIKPLVFVREDPDTRMERRLKSHIQLVRLHSFFFITKQEEPLTDENCMQFADRLVRWLCILTNIYLDWDEPFRELFALIQAERIVPDLNFNRSSCYRVDQARELVEGTPEFLLLTETISYEKANSLLDLITFHPGNSEEFLRPLFEDPEITELLTLRGAFFSSFQLTTLTRKLPVTSEKMYYMNVAGESSVIGVSPRIALNRQQVKQPKDYCTTCSIAMSSTRDWANLNTNKKFEITSDMYWKVYSTGAKACNKLIEIFNMLGLTPERPSEGITMLHLGDGAGGFLLTTSTICKNSTLVYNSLRDVKIDYFTLFPGIAKSLDRNKNLLSATEFEADLCDLTLQETVEAFSARGKVFGLITCDAETVHMDYSLRIQLLINVLTVAFRTMVANGVLILKLYANNRKNSPFCQSLIDKTR